MIHPSSNFIVKDVESADKEGERISFIVQVVRHVYLYYQKTSTNAWKMLLDKNVQYANKSNTIPLSSHYICNVATLYTNNASKSFLSISISVLYVSKASAICGFMIDNLIMRLKIPQCLRNLEIERLKSFAMIALKDVKYHFMYSGLNVACAIVIIQGYFENYKQFYKIINWFYLHSIIPFFISF